MFAITDSGMWCWMHYSFNCVFVIKSFQCIYSWYHQLWVTGSHKHYSLAVSRSLIVTQNSLVCSRKYTLLKYIACIHSHTELAVFNALSFDQNVQTQDIIRWRHHPTHGGTMTLPSLESRMRTRSSLKSRVAGWPKFNTWTCSGNQTTSTYKVRRMLYLVFM